MAAETGIASLVCVALVYGLTRRIYGSGLLATLAAALLAISPFAILFAPTAFTDPWFAVWLLAAAWAAVAGKPIPAGILAGLAVASKQQGVLAAPLVLTLMALPPADQTGPNTGGRLSWYLVHRFLPALLGFALIFIPVTYWDSLRWAKRPSFWDRSLDTYGGLRLALPTEWPSAWPPGPARPATCSAPPLRQP